MKWRYIRTLSRKQVMEQFQKLFHTSKNNNMFLHELSKLIGSDGMNINEELSFYWYPASTTHTNMNSNPVTNAIYIKKKNIKYTEEIILTKEMLDKNNVDIENIRKILLNLILLKEPCDESINSTSTSSSNGITSTANTKSDLYNCIVEHIIDINTER